ncbi:bifunctional nuclease family protein [Haliangium ochraceum]|uniref:BFN domain-containing protein n=1 Tax=Haliangium ochraceum (strain DSM 14365 / JCM 11303 / SMP-2) TaxID=502025 RepID=D0LII7_HALO1|nr:bifunctional nuclease family protein [Haliangium ochraceum]ACY18343.1 protein of unknown function DUF151 [Haliangium ochraceum DSM 14365]
MKVSTLSVDPISGLPVILLTDDCHRMLPISVGLGEVSAVAAELGCIEFERPTTHHLMAELLEKTGATVTRVDIHCAAGDRLDARIHLRLPSGETAVQDSRPSDALILALRGDIAITVEPEVLESRGHSVEEYEGFAPPSPSQSLTEIDLPELVSASLTSKWKM